MAIEIKAPPFPESVADGTVATWHKQVGEFVQRDELLVDIETDKIVLEIVATEDGVLKEIVKDAGETVESGEVLGSLEPGAAAVDTSAAPPQEAATSAAGDGGAAQEQKLSPAARKIIEEKNLDASAIRGTGKGGLVTKEDALAYAAAPAAAPAPSQASAAASKPETVTPLAPPTDAVTGRIEKRVPMTRMRARIAERLLEAKQSTAMLTTFNEVNMQPIMDLRRHFQDSFTSKHGIKLGFMGLFVKAATEALKRFPIVNASIDGNDVVYHGYQDIGIAVSTERGLVVPILRDTDRMGIADIEKKIADYGLKARDGKLGIEDMQGGTFTLTNGGIFGSLMSTPILNPPQAAILGMHKIQERPMVEKGEVVIRPMMNLALSYDHRLIDGKDSVQFLVTVKGLLEEPARILLDV
jgi:2-oxoglutarate dehydrogenase E2 component (dihydrolipoamide succinyltransferase)